MPKRILPDQLYRLKEAKLTQFWKTVHSTRAERNIENFGLSSIVQYYLKYLVKQKLKTDSEMMAYFETQSSILAHSSARKKSKKPNQIRLAFIGDIMWTRDRQSESLSIEVKSFLEKFDAVYGNLESVISKSFPISSKLPDHLRFNSPVGLLDAFEKSDKRSILTAVSIANNHILDFGEIGAIDTMRLLDDKKIAYSGARRLKKDQCWVENIIDGFKIGFYGAGYGLNNVRDEATEKLHLNIFPSLITDGGSRKLDLKKIAETLNQMKQSQIEVKIVFLHWGHEFEHYPTENQMQMARDIISAGADVVVGSHSHVAQPDEVVFLNGREKSDPLATTRAKKKIPSQAKMATADGVPRKAYVCYSLGNFLTAMFTDHCRKAPVRSLTFYRDGNGRVDWKEAGIDFLNNVSVANSLGRELVFLHT